MPLTNEQLYSFVIDGNNDLKPVLWERVRKLMYSYANKYFRSHTEQCTANGLDEWDLKQDAYIAFEKSFEKYDPEGGAAYSTWLYYCFQNTVRSEFKRGDTLSKCSSLDVLAFENDDTTAIIDTVADETSSAGFEKVEKEIFSEQVGEIMKTASVCLNEKQMSVVNLFYFAGRTLPEIAAHLNVSRNRAAQVKAEALDILRHCPQIYRLRDDLGYSSSKLYEHNSVEYIATARADIEAELREYHEWVQKRERQEIEYRERLLGEIAKFRKETVQS